MSKIKFVNRPYFLTFFLIFSFIKTFGQVTDYSPRSIIAGNESILTIKGRGFGATRGTTGYVSFPPTIKVLETDYVMWTDTEIRVKVPLGSGSGSPVIVTSNGTSFNVGYVETMHLMTNDRFSPSHISAGTGSVLTISGSGFGPVKTSRNFVEFLGGDAWQSTVRPLAEDYLSWTDTEIKLRVPSGAGDGPLYITMDNGTMKVIHPWLIIDYGVYRKDGLDTKLANANGAGGYTFRLHTSLNSNNKAKAAFLNAFETWKCATGVNWKIGEPTSSISATNVVRILDEDEWDYGAIVQTSTSYIKQNSTWYIGNVAITFSKLPHWFKFNSSESGLYDFESVALHALGKALNLEVVINENNVMYWGRKVTETEKRSLSQHDINAGAYMVDFSKVSSTSIAPMVPLSPGNCMPAYSYINSFSPASANAGQEVTIKGTNFFNVTSVRFGGVPATSFTVISPTEIKAVINSGSSSGMVSVHGSVDVATAFGFTFIDKLSQTLSYNQFPVKNFGDPDFEAGVSASTGLPVVYTSSNPSVATILDNKIQIIGAGHTIISAIQSGNEIYSAVRVDLNLYVNKANQTVRFEQIPNKLVGDPDFDLHAVSSSGLPVYFISTNPAVAIIKNARVQIVGSGISTIIAKQDGNENYNVASNVSVELIVSNLAQTLTFPEIAEKKITDPDFDPEASVTSGLPITYTSSNIDVAIIVNNKIRITGAGITTITASQSGSITYAPVSKQVTMVVKKLSQQISLPQIGLKTFNDPDFEPGGSTTSDLGLTYSSSNLGVAVVVNNKIRITGAGTTIISAHQIGSAIYETANAAVKMEVKKADQTINFQYLALKKHNDSDFELQATSSSGLPVSFKASNQDVVKIIDNKVQIIAAGTTVITAFQEGNANYNAAIDVSQPLNVVYIIPISNYSIKTTNLTCKNSNNGSINITATTVLTYTAVITGNNKNLSLPFNNSLILNDLAAGTYNVCITIAGQPAYKQCFDVSIKEPKDLAVYSSLKDDGNILYLKLEGADRYHINLNGKLITTGDNEISLPLVKGKNTLKISSDKSCQGKIEKTFLTSDGVELYPNPVKDHLTVQTRYFGKYPIKIEIYSLDGRRCIKGQYTPDSGRISLNIANFTKGVYILTMNIGGQITIHKFIKD